MYNQKGEPVALPFCAKFRKYVAHTGEKGKIFIKNDKEGLLLELLVLYYLGIRANLRKI